MLFSVLMPELETLAIVGAGSWGTALAISLAGRFQNIRLWGHNRQRLCEMQRTRENAQYLPGFGLPQNVCISHDLGWTVRSAQVVLSVVPSRFLREVAGEIRDEIGSETILISATKGIEDGTGFRMSQVLGQALRLNRPVAVLSGPTFAREIAAGEPAAVVIACEDTPTAEIIQRAFATPSLRFYTSGDVIGVELGAALKNVIAIGAGICRGMGLGSNSVAALITRGLAEITRLAVNMGGNPRTLSGLAGLGDLLLTATGDLSRNRQVGIQLGRGEKLPEILNRMTMVAEGVETCRAAYQVAQARNVDMPIISKMYEVLYEDKDPKDGMRELMDRPLTSE